MYTIPRDWKILMRKRASLNKALLKVSNHQKKLTVKSRIADIEVKICQSHKQQRLREENKATETIKSNPKHFFNFAKRFSKLNAPIGPLVTSEGQMEEDAKNISEILAEQYRTVFSIPDQTKVISDPTVFFSSAQNTQDTVTLEDIMFTEEDIIKAIKEIKPNSAAGQILRKPSILIGGKFAVGSSGAIVMCFDRGNWIAQRFDAVDVVLFQGELPGWRDSGLTTDMTLGDRLRGLKTTTSLGGGRLQATAGQGQAFTALFCNGKRTGVGGGQHLQGGPPHQEDGENKAHSPTHEGQEFI
ncbi:hypothetical protein GWK47_021420 [Chionoecetes opilio]|uniref:Uncharacterized protein n=1 Tax=Chionoecetes opilio TaxID=41210 RepID=A0A8J4XSZ3_CHIOP|nr:hypothetical protein GWK47_021420 [Chionoecetes opilio]